MTDNLDISVKKGKILINFTEKFKPNRKSTKPYYNLTIRTKDKESMDELMQQVIQLFSYLQFPEIRDINYHYPTSPTFLPEATEYFNLPEFQFNTDYLKCPDVILMIEKVEHPIREELIASLSAILNKKINEKTTNVWFPDRPLELSPYKNKMWVSSIKNKYPIYVISLGRWEKRLTQRYLEWSGLDYYVVVEPREYDKYAEHIPRDKLLVCPEDYSITRKIGSIPVRNFVWQHSIKNGDTHHWILDDNIRYYARFYNSQKVVIKGGLAFRVVEDYVDRFKNVKMAGHNYSMFVVTSNTTLRPITFNSRVYSSILLSNDLLTDNILDEGWRGTYNEDTDLSLRVLYKGFPTFLFNSFCANKVCTMESQTGGNTTTIYNVQDGYLKKSQYLVDTYPEITKLVYKFRRMHHYVDYSGFKNLKLEYKEGVRETLKEESNNYDLELVELDNSFKFISDK
jgi:hypothetical protein